LFHLLVQTVHDGQLEVHDRALFTVTDRNAVAALIKNACAKPRWSSASTRSQTSTASRRSTSSAPRGNVVSVARLQVSRSYCATPRLTAVTESPGASECRKAG
jgi:hypothetical protein